MTQENSHTRRILAEFGNRDEFAGFTLADLRLLVPAVFTGLLIAGNTPAVVQPAGWVGGAAIIGGCLIVIYVTPEHQTAAAFLRDRLQFVRKPTLYTRTSANDSDPLAPTLRQNAINEETASDSAPPGESDDTATTQALSELERFHLVADAGQRQDGYVFGAIEVTPANMALATEAEWEHAVERFSELANTVEFSFQIYSSVTPVDPERICRGYRDRLHDTSETMSPAFQELVATYAEAFPREFAQRGTGVREYYVIVPISPLEVDGPDTGFDHDSLLDQLADLAYVGGFFRELAARRQSLSPDERRARQLAELDRRLDAVAAGIQKIPGCSTHRLDTASLAAVLNAFWAGSDMSGEGVVPEPRTSPIVTAEEGESR